MTLLAEDGAQSLALQVGMGNVTEYNVTLLNHCFSLVNIVWMSANRRCNNSAHARFWKVFPSALIHCTMHLGMFECECLFMC